MLRHFAFKYFRQVTLIFSFIWMLMPYSFGVEPQMETDELLKPLTPGPSYNANPSEATPLQGSAKKQQPQTQSVWKPSVTSTQPTALKIQIKTYQEAVVAERGRVDWYAWYLAAREYLAATGGLNRCMVGTPIKFYKEGRIEAMSPDPFCQMSVKWRRFPLPSNTQLDALILPVRPGKLPPASPAEIQQRIQSNKTRNQGTSIR